MLNTLQTKINTGGPQQGLRDNSPLSPLLGKLNSLENTIKELNSAIGLINERLQPILAPMAPEVKASPNSPYPISEIPLVSQINELEHQLTNSIGWLQDITNRLGV